MPGSIAAYAVSYRLSRANLAGIVIPTDNARPEAFRASEGLNASRFHALISEQCDQEIYLQIFSGESQMEIGSKQIFRQVTGDSGRNDKKRPRISPEQKEGDVSFIYSA
jgi:hypothetical protein